MIMKNRQYLIRVIQECADEFYRVPEWGLKKDTFDERSYRKWAIGEVINIIRIADDPKKELNLMLLKTEKWSQNKNTEIGKIFSLLYEATELAVDIINSMKGGF